MPMPTPSTHYMEKEYDTFAMANKLKHIRTSRGYSLSYMASLIGISYNQINRIEEHNSKNISKKYVQLVSDKFSIPLSEIVVARDPENKDYALWTWIANEKESLPYLQRAFYEYLRDKGKI